VERSLIEVQRGTEMYRDMYHCRMRRRIHVSYEEEDTCVMAHSLIEVQRGTERYRETTGKRTTGQWVRRLTESEHKQ
jgi:hypothetical protein